MNRVLPVLLFPCLVLSFHGASAAPGAPGAASGADMAREYDQVRTIALRDPKVQRAFEKANAQLEAKILEIDPALENYVKARKPAAVPGAAPGAGFVAAAPSTAGPVLKPLIKPSESRGDLQRSRSHVLAAGETLGAVAARYRVPVADLRRVNHIKDDRKLVVGQVIVIPGPARP
jgi:hypothetical protein